MGSQKIEEHPIRTDNLQEVPRLESDCLGISGLFFVIELQIVDIPRYRCASPPHLLEGSVTIRVYLVRATAAYRTTPKRS